MKPYYEADGITIYHGDALGMMPEVSPGADVLVTDPPYGIAYRSGQEGALPGIEGDEDTSLRDRLLSGWWQGRPAIVFGSWRAPRPSATVAVLTWEKGLHSGMGDLSIPWKPNTEEVYVIGGGFSGHRGSAVLRFNAPMSWNSGGRRLHAHQKPVDLMRALVSKCPPGVILDPFMGSGTTLRAAKDLGRKAIGIEIEERYCEIAAKRMGQRVLFSEAAS